MNWQEKYEQWIQFEQLDKELKEQLNEKKNDEEWIIDSFYKNLEFGTGGMRGELGPGTNRMNVYTVRKAAEGLARYISSFGEDAKNRGVVIAYDSRYQSPEFAMESAKTLAGHGILSYVFEELRPTPELSFAVRHLQAFAGIVITASHNPPEYNGFKVYGEDGGQLPPQAADELILKVNEVKNELLIEVRSETQLKEAGLIKIIGQEIDQAYINQLKTIVLNPALLEQNKVKVIFTPLHGTANRPVRDGLHALGFTNIVTVKEQENPDPEFSTVTSPNPEEHAAFSLAINEGEKEEADLLIATDPDADRLGIAVKDEDGKYVVLTGNQTGGLFLEYILSQQKEKGILPNNGVVLKTIVTSELGQTIASHYGLDTVDTLTGFKFIGEKIKEYELTNQYKFIFGYEESYGYLIGDFARDKDAVQSAIMAVEVAAYYKSLGKTVYEGLMDLFQKYGYFREGLESITLKGKKGAEQIQKLITTFREDQPTLLHDMKIVTVEDYQQQIRVNLITQEQTEIDLPKSNVLKYYLEDGSWFCIRPSGTEPKVKFYFGVKGNSLKESEALLNKVKDNVMMLVGNRLN